jgi:hypothetical protein
MATGLSPCPPFVAMVLIGGEAGGVIAGMAAFLVFFFTTSLYLIPSLFVADLSRFPFIRASSAAASIASGMIFIYKGWGLWF